MLAQNNLKKQSQSLALILVLGFALRLALAVTTEGYVYDINCFFAWGTRMAELGAADFYAADYFCDYPPAYLWVLCAVGHLMNLFGVNYLQGMAQVFLVFIPTLADIAMAWLLYHIANKAGYSKLALRLAAFAAFCPLFWYNTAVWKQIDGVLGVLLLACFYCLTQKRFLPAAALYGLALAVKPQALVFGPVFAVCFLLPLFFAADAKAFWQAMKNGALGVLAALAPLYLTALPFFGFGKTASGLYQLYTSTTSGYPYASVNAFNFMAALGGNWVSQTEQVTLSLFGTSVPMFFTWQALGTFGIVAVSAFALVLALHAQKRSCFSAPLLGAVYMTGVFTFAHAMHERYLLVGVVLLLCAVAQLGSTRLLCLAGALSITTLLNMAAVYTMVETDDAFFTSATSILVLRGVGVAETLLCLWLFYEAWQLCGGKCPDVALFGQGAAPAVPSAQAAQTPPATAGKGEKQQKAENAEPSAPKMPCTPAPQPKWGKGEIIFLSVLTAAVAVLSFVYLGDVTAPQNLLDASENSHVETVLVAGDATNLWVYPGVIQSNATLQVYDASGTLVLDVSLAIGSLFQWADYSIAASSQYTIAVSGAQIMEIGFRNADGNLLSLTAGQGALSALFDEQDLIPDTISQLNGFYFDEIYHARTAYEGLNGLDIYEISHPPMGKNFISLGIAIFGMTGFGWRFSGVLFGVLMVPVIYWLTRRLTRSAMAAGFVALLLSFDFMRYSQSRIATIDVISAFFILLAATCMVWYCQSVLQKGVCKSILPMALSGLAFGFGAASKWTGLYGGVGLATLYFGVLVFSLYQQHIALALPTAGKNKMAAVRKTQFQQLCRKEITAAILGGVGFFVVLPLCIYIASYLPYQLADSSFGLMGIWENQQYMLWYHSTLDATHPFSSPWYTWFFDLRPVWYYMGSGLESGTYASIAGFYNPILCWVGIAAWLRLCFKALSGKGSFVGNTLIILLLSQLLPWLLVTRCTFLYHYFPSFLFTVVAVGLWFKDLLASNKERAYMIGSGMLTLTIFFFVWFYPVLSGLPVGTLWAQTLKLLPSFGFYII